MLIRCPECQTDNTSDSQFCKKCATALPSSEGVSVTKTIETPVEEFARGTLFAERYEIIEELGKGGMGNVYRAVDKKLKEEVALKLIKPDIASDKKTLERFQNELKMARKIRHSNVGGMYELLEDKGKHYITMEYVSGEDLKSFIRRAAPLSTARTVAIAKQVCEGLVEAHKLGIVHRDLKPSNIMIDKEGNARIMDFGIARSLSTKGLTDEGIIIGTPEYMSPEQAEAREVDHRSDIYSLGIILYEMATGQVPFEGDTPLSIAMKHKGVAPKDPRAHNPQIPKDLSRLILRCMEKKRESRYQSAEELLSELSRIGKPTAETISVAKRKSSIAVLPFTNMSADPEQEYFCDGMTEEIINALTHIENLRVIARTSAFAFKGKHEVVREIGEKLDVETLLEGSVRKTGNRLRITAQLIDVADGSHLWSDRFDREMKDVFAIQDEITLSIVKKLKGKLLRNEKEELLKQHTSDHEAYTLYLKGRFYFHKLTIPDLQQAAQYFQQAIDLDPNYARAYAGLAGASMFMGGAGPSHFLPPSESYPQARAAITKAMELDDRLPEAHTMLGVLRTGFEWDFEGSELAFKCALELNPKNADTYFWYAWHLWKFGNIDAAMAAVKRALVLDPLSLLFQSMIGLLHYSARRYDEGIDQFKQVLELEPNFFHSNMHLGDAYLAKGMYKDAKAAYKKAQKLAGRHAYLYIGICRLYAVWNRRDEAMKYMNEVIAISKEEWMPPTYIGWAYLALGEHDEAFVWFDKAFKERDPQLLFQEWPMWDPIKSDPRYLALVKKMGLE